MTLDALSKSDFTDLGCEDVSGPQLRARVFVLEGLAAELALTLEALVKDITERAAVRIVNVQAAVDALESARPSDQERELALCCEAIRGLLRILDSCVYWPGDGSAQTVEDGAVIGLARELVEAKK